MNTGLKASQNTITGEVESDCECGNDILKTVRYVLGTMLNITLIELIYI